jgi:hypothetical protein
MSATPLSAADFPSTVRDLQKIFICCCTYKHHVNSNTQRINQQNN